jgi:hypothetical protein
VAGAVATIVAVTLHPGLARCQSTQEQQQQAQQALREAEVRFHQAEAQLLAARKSYERTRYAASGRALAEQLQSLDWLFIEAADQKIFVTTEDGQRGGFKAGQEHDRLSLELPLAKDVKVLIDGKPHKLTDLGRWMQVSLELAEDAPEVAAIKATSSPPGPALLLEAIKPAQRLILVSIGGKVSMEGIPVAADAEIRIYPDECDIARLLEDLSPGMHATLGLSVKDGRIVVKRIHARR